MKIYESDDGADPGHASHPVRRLGRAWSSRRGGKGAHARSPAPVGRRGHDKGVPHPAVCLAPPSAARPLPVPAGRGVGFLLAPLRMLCPGHCSSRLCPRIWRVQAGVHRQKAQLRRVGAFPERHTTKSHEFHFVSFRFFLLCRPLFSKQHTQGDSARANLRLL